ncbi:MAG: 3TM-type holin [Alphaproteobacteria bacterium]|jgi:hypothetical protein
MIPALLAQIGLPLLARAVGGALSNIDHPVAAAAASALSAVDAEIDGGKISASQVAEANRHVERMEELTLARDVGVLTEINRTIRTEAMAEDAYVRRMRPTFGYIMAISWAAQMLAIAFVIVARPADAGAVIAAMASLGTIWSVGLSVLGIYVYKRSQDKAAAVAAPPTGIFAALMKRISAN